MNKHKKETAQEVLVQEQLINKSTEHNYISSEISIIHKVDNTVVEIDNCGITISIDK
ncbi:hypothetical protein H7E67_10380 [Clostridium gasigenes]|uniref:hypothetical protein n=1 Tax=Clostridium gasigenes TaxID=94869 RepID=UPI001628CE73|nr:hypothetical protein [Clostridium gasigenes]MBB6623833.1 hypothetical protein [Clostridium gasigenes]